MKLLGPGSCPRDRSCINRTNLGHICVLIWALCSCIRSCACRLSANPLNYSPFTEIFPPRSLPKMRDILFLLVFPVSFPLFFSWLFQVTLFMCLTFHHFHPEKVIHLENATLWCLSAYDFPRCAQKTGAPGKLLTGRMIPEVLSREKIFDANCYSQSQFVYSKNLVIRKQAIGPTFFPKQLCICIFETKGDRCNAFRPVCLPRQIRITDDIHDCFRQFGVMYRTQDAHMRKRKHFTPQLIGFISGPDLFVPRRWETLGLQIDCFRIRESFFSLPLPAVLKLQLPKENPICQTEKEESRPSLPKLKCLFKPSLKNSFWKMTQNRHNWRILICPTRRRVSELA